MTHTSPQPRIRLLGGFRLDCDSRPVHVVPGVRRLLALLALQQTSIERAAAAATLWPDTTARRAAACLRSTLWRLVKSSEPLVVSSEDALALDARVEVDFRRARELAAVVTAPGCHPDETAVTLLQADLLPGWDHDWVHAEQDWWRQARLRALEALSHRFRSSGDRHRAYLAAMSVVRTDPLRESAHRTLVELHIADGNPAAAVRQYASYRTRLRDELGLSPSPQIHDLVKSLLAGA
ncbi:AfsR/SARP family transcriptional regulator [Kibdelosporangium aridum]|uniref:DNA-binding transcriptional activator of the SARP family n=1 Tax=Kibdelosporangium aridum TaxID=2030 RepID=A0A1W2FW32_KIBAR|nr:bacterial transcriptional activator domain-containing protein [Kibdelosporangium aridum]SMD25818.1 DNA-binding transcriptional activator of the SARP family [Kibdelosporangium aridum]